MESSITTSSSCSLSDSSAPSLQHFPHVASRPCAACKIRSRRCDDKCIMAPYFPPSEPLKFITAHRVFGSRNIAKFLQGLPESQRADAVNCMVYEANARIMDPVNGCAGMICQLQQQVSDIYAKLVTTQLELMNLQNQYMNLLAMNCEEMAQLEQFEAQPFNTIDDIPLIFPGTDVYLDDNNQDTSMGLLMDINLQNNGF